MRSEGRTRGRRHSCNGTVNYITAYCPPVRVGDAATGQRVLCDWRPRGLILGASTSIKV